MPFDCDAVVIGAGVAGASAAIWLAQGGWHVMLVEQHAYPRRKVCGECIAAGNLPLLDQLGVGAPFRHSAGPELRRVGWMQSTTTACTEMPMAAGVYGYGRVLGRDRLDALLLERAQAVGVQVLQPARVRAVSGHAGDFACAIDVQRRTALTCRAPVVIDAHGSWERAPTFSVHEAAPPRRRSSDLFAFKANFRESGLPAGFLPVLSLPGGYGGMVQGDGGRMTIACCLRRDALADCRASMPDLAAGPTVEAHLRRYIRGVGDALAGARRDGAWLSVGPLAPGIRVESASGTFRVGNAAGESHPLIGEGISMALQSSSLLAAVLLRQPPAALCGKRAIAQQRLYAHAWRRTFSRRLRLAALFAHVAMRPALAGPACRILQHWPALLRAGARLTGKASSAVDTSFITPEIA